jgi:glycerol-3-phosphate dehydrogenase
MRMRVALYRRGEAWKDRSMNVGEVNSQADTVVIGGGIAGAATAYYLARGGQKVVLVETSCASRAATRARFR